MTSHQRKLGAPTLVGASFRRAAVSSHDFAPARSITFYRGRISGGSKWPDCIGRFNLNLPRYVATMLAK